MSLNSQNLLEAMDGVSLLIDRNLIIRYVGWRNWNSFWSSNGGAMAPADVVGHDVTIFFSEGEVRETYRKLFCDVVGKKRQRVQVDYRCDSPVLRRSMRLSVAALPNAHETEYLLYQSTLLALEQRPAIPLFDAVAVGTSQTDILKICAICAKVQWPVGAAADSGEWIEPQEYYHRGGSDVILLSHGFCRPCYEVLAAEED